MIPKKIHYCWFGGGPMSDLNKRCMDTWAAIMPDYEIKRWDESNSAIDSPYCRAAYEQKRWSRLSNHVRLKALCDEGGIYFDTDVEVLRTFDDLLDSQGFLGFQCKKENDEWVNSAIAGAVRGQPVFKEILNETEEFYARTGELRISPAVVTSVFRAKGLTKYGRQQIDGVALYPREFFYPYPWDEVSEGITPNTYCIHHWEGSWLEEQPRPSLARRVLGKGKAVLRIFFR